METESLKNYLVKIGWNVDELGFRSANEKLSSFRSSIENMGSGMAGSFLKAGMVVIETIYKINNAMFQLIETTANADLQVEKFARRMWTTESNARSLTTALDVLGMSYDDLFYATEEQYQRFVELNNLGKQLEAPPALDETLVKVRDVQMEVSRLKMIFQYATRWVVYYLGEMNGGDLNELIKDFKIFNNWVIRNIPVITEKIAYFFNVFYRLGKTALTFVVNTGKEVIDIFGEMGDSGVKMIATLSAAFFAIKSGPLGMFILLLGAALLLLEDFYVWQKGGKSLFGDQWEKLDSTIEGFSDQIGDLKENVSDLFDNLEKIADSEIFKGITKQLVEDFLSNVDLFLKSINSSLETINSLLDLLTGKFDLDNLKDSAKQHLDNVGGLFGNLGKYGLPNNNLSNTGKLMQIISSILGLFDKDGNSAKASANNFAGGTVNNSNVTNNQTNNFTINSSSASAEDIATKTANKIASYRMWTQNT